jgi:hypothetical protein
MNHEDRVFTVASDDTLIELINVAKNRIVFVAPGLTKRVAEALGKRLPEEETVSVSVILDADPEVYRLGFGTPEGLSALRAYANDNHVGLRCQEGVRIGLLIVDDKTLIYAPTPQLIEAGSTSVDKPNAILLDGPQTTTTIAHATGAADHALASTAEIGKEALTPERLQKVEENLKNNPPKPFDLARQANVFSSKLQYVEFEVSNYRVSRMRARIPADLIGLSQDNVAWHNTVQMIDDEAATVTIGSASEFGPEKLEVNPEYIENERRKIEQEFIYTIPNYGRVVYKAFQKGFEEKVSRFEAMINAYFSALREQITEKVSAVSERVAEALLPRVKDSPPERYCRHVERPSEEEIRGLLGRDIRRALAGAIRLERHRVRYLYKDIAYQTFMDKDFIEKLRNVLERNLVPESMLKDIFLESSAVLEKGGKLAQ